MSQPKVIVVDTRNASDYEREEIREIAEWKGRAPGAAAKWLGRAAAPVDRAIRSVLSDETVENALAEANRLAAKTIRDEGAKPLPDGLEPADQEARNARNWAVSLASAGGAGAGAAGVAGLVVDIPFTVTLSLRAIRRIGAAYGYTSAHEDGFALRVLAAAAANTMTEKSKALAALEEGYDGEVSNAASSRMAVAKEGAVFATRGLAASLARNLAGRKAAQAVPVIGAAIGAVVSAAFLEDVCTAARRLYQERFLRDREVLDGPIG